MNLLQVYLGSPEIKKQMVKRSDEFRIPFKFICAELGINYDSFLDNYINAVDSSKYKISEETFEKILNLLGMETRYNIILKKNFDAEGVREQVKKTYELKNGKRTSTGIQEIDFET